MSTQEQVAGAVAVEVPLCMLTSHKFLLVRIRVRVVRVVVLGSVVLALSNWLIQMTCVNFNVLCNEIWDERQQAASCSGSGLPSKSGVGIVLCHYKFKVQYRTVRTYGWCERDEYSDLGTSEWHRVMICNECLDWLTVKCICAAMPTLWSEYQLTGMVRFVGETLGRRTVRPVTHIKSKALFHHRYDISIYRTRPVTTFHDCVVMFNALFIHEWSEMEQEGRTRNMSN